MWGKNCFLDPPYFRLPAVVKWIKCGVAYSDNPPTNNPPCYDNPPTDAMYVKLISSDGHEFIIKREHALTSGTIKAMLSGPGQFAENETNEVNFREIPSHVLQKVWMYFTYKVRYTNSSTEIPKFPHPARNCFGTPYGS
jgi:transcription elongation factor B subunit 1